MNYEIIGKGEVAEMAVKPNLLNYGKVRDNFRWEDIHGELDWLDGGGLNIAYEAVDRHIKGSLKDKVALYWEGRSEEHTSELQSH